VLAIAPTSAIAFRIELLRAISTGDDAEGLRVARDAIENDIENRQFAFGGAVQYLLRAAVRNGTVAEESAYLEQQAPGILDSDAEIVPVKFLLAQRVALDAWFTTLAEDELMRRVARIQEIATSYGIDLQNSPVTRVDLMVMQNKTEDAVQLALSDVFNRPVTLDQDWRTRYSQAQYKTFVKDPRIQDAMKRWEADEAAIREQVRNYLLDLSSAS
jgi:hypothetical protein